MTDIKSEVLEDLQNKSDVELLKGIKEIKESVVGEETSRDALISKPKDAESFANIAELNKAIVKERLKGLGLGEHADILLKGIGDEHFDALADKNDVELLKGVKKIKETEDQERETIVTRHGGTTDLNDKDIVELNKAIDKAKDKEIVKERLKGLGLDRFTDSLLTDIDSKVLAGFQNKSDVELLKGIKEERGKSYEERGMSGDTGPKINKISPSSYNALNKAIVKERLKELGLGEHADSLLTDLKNEDLEGLQDKSDVELLIGIKEKVGQEETISRDAIGSGDGIDMNIDDIVELNKAIVKVQVTERLKEMGVHEHVSAEDVQSKIRAEVEERNEAHPVAINDTANLTEGNFEESIEQITNAALKVMKDKIMESVKQKVSEGDTSKESQHQETSEHLGKIETHPDAASKLSGLLEMAKEGSFKAANLKEEIKTVAERTPEAPSKSSESPESPGPSEQL